MLAGLVAAIGAWRADVVWRPALAQEVLAPVLGWAILGFLPAGRPASLRNPSERATTLAFAYAVGRLVLFAGVGLVPAWMAALALLIVRRGLGPAPMIPGRAPAAEAPTLGGLGGALLFALALAVRLTTEIDAFALLAAAVLFGAGWRLLRGAGARALVGLALGVVPLALLPGAVALGSVTAGVGALGALRRADRRHLTLAFFGLALVDLAAPWVGLGGGAVLLALVPRPFRSDAWPWLAGLALFLALRRFV